ncbi:hypothetical protein D3C83_182210 [compost metagenome]
MELATLDHDTILSDAPNGWRVVETEIEFSDFHVYPGGSTNSFRLMIDTSETDETVLASIIEYY